MMYQNKKKSESKALETQSFCGLWDNPSSHICLGVLTR